MWVGAILEAGVRGVHRVEPGATNTYDRVPSGGDMKLYSLDGQIYAKMGINTLCWRRVDTGWDVERVDLPDGVLPIDFAVLPEELREEVLAAAARAGAVGSAGRGEFN